MKNKFIVNGIRGVAIVRTTHFSFGHWSVRDKIQTAQSEMNKSPHISNGISDLCRWWVSMLCVYKLLTEFALWLDWVRLSMVNKCNCTAKRSTLRTISKSIIIIEKQTTTKKMSNSRELQWSFEKNTHENVVWGIETLNVRMLWKTAINL